jgi:hypothetical protein
MRNLEALLERLLELYKKEGIDKSITAYLLPFFEEVKMARHICLFITKSPPFPFSEPADE